MKFFKIISFLFCVLLFSTCNKDDGATDTEQEQQQLDHDAILFAQNFGSEILRTFLGTVVDTNNNPIEGVRIYIGNSTAMTDSNGVFIIQDAPVKERFGYVTAEKSGFIHASRSVVPSDGTNKVTIMMLPETIVGTTSSGTQETITLANGSKVALEGDYIKPDGTTYSGNVNVIMHHLDPADDNMRDQMPGMLYAANAQNEARMLQTFGMLAVELRGENGEDLNIAEGSSAEIRVPLDASLLEDAPTTIPLWYFHEANGYWIGDGQATLVGNSYVGTVTHFSFWTCSIIHLNHNTLSLNIKDSEGTPLNNIRVSLSNPNLKTVSTYTNNSGIVSGLVPSNELIEIDISSESICEGNSIFNTVVGPFSSNSSITINLPSSTEIFTENIYGEFNDCDGQQINEGYIFITHGSKVFVDEIINSSFNTNLLRCNNDIYFKVNAIDFNTFNSSGEINYTFTTPTTQLGQLSACDTINEFIQYKIDNNDYVFILDFSGAYFFPEDSSSNNNNPRLYIYSGENVCFHLTGKINESNYEDTYDDLNWNITNDYGFNIYDCNTVIQEAISETNNQIIYNLNNLGEVGEYIDINISGTYEDTEGVIREIYGVIHVLRDY